MVNRMLVLLFAFALVLCMSAPLVAEDSHEGTFVGAKGTTEFTMEDKGKEHSHVLSSDAKVIDADGKACKLADLKKGQKIRVTTKEGDKKTATKVEAIK